MDAIEPTDPFLTLLTDALRAGPGSPAWHDAVGQLRAGGVQGADEYKLLLAARENLESGRDYRAVRAGPGFTRKVMEGIERGGDRGGKPPFATAVAILALLVVLTVLGVLAYWLVRGGGPATVNDLTEAYFANPVAGTTFDGPLSKEWKTVGALPLDPAGGLHPGPTTRPVDGFIGYTGGALLLAQPLPADKAFAVEVTLKLNKPGDDVIPQVFVTDQPDFSADRSTTPHELAWIVRAGSAQVVLPDGRFDGTTAKLAPGQLLVRIAFDKDSAAVTTAGKPTWAGANGLSSTAPRTVGMRFLAKPGNESRDAVVVSSVRVIGK